MACTDCFNGCNPITPDKCVKYTGVDRPDLDIEKGDTLFSVEDNIILKILDIMVGEGIIPTVNYDDLCSIIQGYLPPVGPYNLNDYIKAVTSAVCTNTDSITFIENVLNQLNTNYTLGCITGVVAADIDDTHKVLQAVITNFCALKVAHDALVLEIPTLYVKKADLDGYIEQYLIDNAPSNLVSNKMIPFVAVEYYGTLANFNASGAGLGLWDKVYLCNGANGTPDKRGRVPVGITTVVGGGAYNPAVDPGISGNPNYVLNTPLGANTVTLNINQIPAHTHIPTLLVTDPGHSHTVTQRYTRRADFANDELIVDVSNTSTSDGPVDVTRVTTVTGTGVTVTATNSSIGGGESHSNIQPVLPCYYIMHIP